MDYYEESIGLLSSVLGVDLAEKTRKRLYVWMRFACYKYFRENGVRVQSIADMFSVDHSNVVYGIKQMKEKLRHGDETAKGCEDVVGAHPAAFAYVLGQIPDSKKIVQI